MYSYFVRANVIVFFSLSALVVLSAACCFTASLHDPPISTHLNYEIIQFRNSNRAYVNGEQVIFDFDIQSDLRPIWNWNVKQLFVWITVTYESPSRVTRTHTHTTPLTSHSHEPANTTTHAITNQQRKTGEQANGSLENDLNDES